ncbi:MAG: GNAT family N-acetyltransferase [Actinobacteria bacterium]|nr:GNAT family N-acetyltransferase [Actinomycetota bacterium]
MVTHVAADGTRLLSIDDPVRIRRAVPADLDGLSGQWGPDREESQRRVLRRYFEEQALGIQQGHVADFNGHCVGQLWTRLRNIDPNIAERQSVVYLHTLVVIPQFRRLGVAEALTRATSDQARESGVEHLTIGVDRPNDYARRLYEKWGFQRYYETFDYRGDLVFLRRRPF